MADEEEMHDTEEGKSEVNNNKDSPEILDETRRDSTASATTGAGQPSLNNSSKIKMNNSSLSNRSYKQKYKHAWELDTELKGWLTACRTDAYAGFCKFCQTKLHAHKKGLLAHAKSSKHKKHVENPNYAPDALALMSPESFQLDVAQNGDFAPDEMDSFARKKIKSSGKNFNESWLKDPSFSQWLRKVPNNNCKALCIACRCVISAGRCELIKHTRAAKHKKAMLEGPFEEVGEDDLQWLDQSDQDNIFSPNKSVVAILQHQDHARHLDLPGLMVDDIIERLNKHVPLDLAEDWDNVGVIVKPTQPVKVYNLLLTIDLTERIVEEAIKKRVQFIISYHPPVFSPIKRLKPSHWKERAILMCIENKIAIYSPHTALDAIKGGINDWLISSFMTSEGNKIRPIVHSKDRKNTTCLEVLLTEPPDTVAQAFKDVNNVTMTECANMCGTSSTDVRVACDSRTLPQVIEQLSEHNVTQVCSRLTQLAPVPIAGIGMGRIVTFRTPLPLYEVIERTKTHLDLQYVRLALSRKHTRDTRVNSIAVCAGSGTSILRGCEADVWITGEMSHHEVLEAVNSGVTVILCEHSNTERGFLRDWSQQLRNSVFEDQVMVTLSELDRDPLRVI